MDTITVIAAAAVLAIVDALMTATEAACEHMPRTRVRRLLESGARGADALESLIEHPSRLRASAALTSSVACAAGGAAGAWFFVRLMPDGIPYVFAGAVGVLVGAAAMFAFAEALPRTVAMQSPERVSLAFSRPTAQLTRFVFPLTRLLSALWVWLMKLTSREHASVSPWANPDEFKAGAHDEDENGREEAEEAILDAVSDFAEKVVREVMVPRTDMVVLPDSATSSDAIELIERTGFTRIPIYHHDADDVRGVLYAKDLLAALHRTDGAVEISRIVRPAYFVPETKPIEELLVEMRSRNHIAIVADEYGGTAGLVTIEDLLEEIVGEIFDEYDREVPLVVDLGHDRYRVDARLPIDDLNEQFGTAIEVDADTVGGMFTVVAGHIPAVGESIEIEGLRLTVEDLQGTRIRQLVVEPARQSSTQEDLDA